MLTESLFSKRDAKVCNQFKDWHSDSPLAIFGESTDNRQNILGEEILTNNVGDFADVSNDI